MINTDERFQGMKSGRVEDIITMPAATASPIYGTTSPCQAWPVSIAWKDMGNNIKEFIPLADHNKE